MEHHHHLGESVAYCDLPGVYLICLGATKEASTLRPGTRHLALAREIQMHSHLNSHSELVQSQSSKLSSAEKAVSQTTSSQHSGDIDIYYLKCSWPNCHLSLSPSHTRARVTRASHDRFEKPRREAIQVTIARGEPLLAPINQTIHRLFLLSTSLNQNTSPPPSVPYR